MPIRTLRRDLLRHPLSFAGAALATASGLFILFFFLASVVGIEVGGPYAGMLAYLIMPALLILALILMPIGLALDRRRRARAVASGASEPHLPVLDFNNPRTRALGLGFVALTTVNVLLISGAAYKGLEVMDSTSFCGSCHKVMDPEATAHARSPHARVRCVECHIGPGASWFVKSKLSGSWQVISVAFNLYPRPIPTPVHNLRPARDTCEGCHWPTKFVGDKLIIRTSHDDDEASTPLKTALLLHVGGRQATHARGIHWHVDTGVKVRYLADPKREHIGRVELVQDGQPPKVFETKEATPAGAVWRDMDCVDCHNRPSHIFRSPEAEVDAAIEAGRIDPKLPFVRKEAVKALKTKYPSAAAARAGIAQAMQAVYLQGDASKAPGREPLVRAASETLGDIWARNVWPQMNIGWGTYPNFLGHNSAPGCFRCHDGDHATKDGEVIRNDCDLCHDLLAQDEKNPAILKALKP